MNKLVEKITIIIFCLFIGGISLWNLFTPDKEFSDNENRYLASKPVVSIDNIINTSFDTDVEKYISDQFVARDNWISIKAAAKMFTGSIANNNVYFANNERLIGAFDTYNMNTINQNIGIINNFSDSIGKEINVMIIPTAAQVEKDSLPAFAYNVDQVALLNDIEGQFTSQNWIDVMGAFGDEQNLYFKTDHHWNEQGALLGYQAICNNVLNKEPNSFTLEKVASDFKGTMFSKAGTFWYAGDDIYRMNPDKDIQVQVNIENTTTMDSVFSDDKLNTKDKYTYYLDGNHSIETITTDVDNDKTAIIIKDSYAHILVPYLISEYHEIIVLDLRYYRTPVSELITDIDNTDIYVIYSLDNFSADTNLAFLK